jgi:hypothetical protein
MFSSGSKADEKPGVSRGVGIQRRECVCDSLNRELTFFNRFLGSVKIEQAKVSKSWRHHQVPAQQWRRARH